MSYPPESWGRGRPSRVAAAINFDAAAVAALCIVPQARRLQGAPQTSQPQRRRKEMPKGSLRDISGTSRTSGVRPSARTPSNPIRPRRLAR